MKHIKIDIPTTYKITDCSDFMDVPYTIPSEAQIEIEPLYYKCRDRKTAKKTILLVKKCILKYPEIPTFYNYLSVAYMTIKDHKSSYKISVQALKKFPNYPFAAANVCSEYLTEKKINQIPKTLKGNLKIEQFAPSRKVFHVAEVVAFYRPILIYHIVKENLHEAEKIISLIKSIAPDTDYLKDTQMMLLTLRGLKNIQKNKIEIESKPKVVYLSYDKTIQTDNPPIFNHPEQIQNLHVYNFKLPNNILNDILKLPRVTLVPDLETIVLDAIRRHEFYLSIEKSQDSDCLIHALFILAELNCEKSLDLFLELLRQGQELLDFWFADITLEDLWEIGSKLGINQLDKLSSFICEPGIWEYSKVCILKSVEQLYFNNKIDKIKTVSWFKSIINYHLNNPHIDNLIDSNVISDIICVLMDLRIVDEFITEIEKLFNNGWVLTQVCGTLNIVMEDGTRSSNEKMYKHEICNIYNRYKLLARKYNKTDEEDAEDEKRQTLAFNKFMSEQNEEQELPLDDFMRSETKVGRNDPCPCGSGKKYKKCCLK